MAFIGNIVWFICGGWLLGLTYLLGSIILFPLFPFLLPMISYSFWPFGRKPVSKKAIKAYKLEHEMEIDYDKFEAASGFIKFLGTVVWAFTLGWILAILHIISGLANLMLCVCIVTIPVCLPNALANFKLVSVAFAPFGVRLIPTPLAEDIEKAYAKATL